MGEAIEYVLFSKRECYAYSIPPATSSAAFRASDWGPCIWTGRCQLIAKGDILLVKLVDNHDCLFLACPIPNNVPLDSCLERTQDSSRYFVLKLTDPKSGRKALMGFGFDERNDAFDFNVSIQDFRSRNIQADNVHVNHATNIFALRSPTKIRVPETIGGSSALFIKPKQVLDFDDFGDFQSNIPTTAANPESSNLSLSSSRLNELDDLFK